MAWSVSIPMLSVLALTILLQTLMHLRQHLHCPDAYGAYGVAGLP